MLCPSATHRSDSGALLKSDCGVRMERLLLGVGSAALWAAEPRSQRTARAHPEAGPWQGQCAAAPIAPDAGSAGGGERGAGGRFGRRVPRRPALDAGVGGCLAVIAAHGSTTSAAAGQQAGRQAICCDPKRRLPLARASSSQRGEDRSGTGLPQSPSVRQLPQCTLDSRSAARNTAPGRFWGRGSAAAPAPLETWS